MNIYYKLRKDTSPGTRVWRRDDTGCEVHGILTRWRATPYSDGDKRIAVIRLKDGSETLVSVCGREKFMREGKKMSAFLKQMVLPFVIKFFEHLLTRENVTLWLDKLFDLMEEMICESETEWDDAIMLPVIKQMRIALDVLDNDKS